MRLSNERIKALQALLKELFGLDCTDEQAHEAGMATMRFIVAKTQRQKELSKNKEHGHGQVRRADRTVTE